jgi:hypothetical protein
MSVMADVGSVASASDRYEHWLRAQVTVVEEDLAHKHELMREGVFAFFRGAYFWWLGTVAVRAPQLDAPSMPSVGDLHVENFGTWRDGEGRLVWGVNDFDESEELPYTYDLARLATSAILAIDDAGLELAAEDACAAILAGYAEGLERGGEPYVLAGKHGALAALVEDALPKPERWWQKRLEDDTPAEPLPAGAIAALAQIAPSGDWHYDARRRVAGVGSLGRPRYVAIGDRDGAPAARELKQLAPPAGRWLDRPATPSALQSRHIVRSPDPLYRIHDGWLARRLAPDCVKLELDEIKHGAAQQQLFESMGRETANIHLGAATESARAVRGDLARRGATWLTRAATTLAEHAHEDWRDFSHG